MVNKTDIIFSFILIVNFCNNSFLVGDGAKQWAEQNGIPLIDNQKMKTGFILQF